MALQYHSPCRSLSLFLISRPSLTLRVKIIAERIASDQLFTLFHMCSEQILGTTVSEAKNTFY